MYSQWNRGTRRELRVRRGCPRVEIRQSFFNATTVFAWNCFLRPCNSSPISRALRYHSGGVARIRRRAARNLSYEVLCTNSWEAVAVSLLLCSSLASCSQDDRVATVTCDDTFGAGLPVTIEASAGGKRTSSIGYLNTRGLTLGTLVRFVRARRRPNHCRVSCIESLERRSGDHLYGVSSFDHA